MKKFFDILISSWKAISAIIGIAGIGWGLYAWQDARKEEERAGFDHIIEQQDSLMKQQGYMMGQMSSVKQGQYEIIDKQKKIIEHQKAQDAHMQKQDETMEKMKETAKFYVDHQEEMTKEAMDEAIELMLKKNENDPIVLNQQ